MAGTASTTELSDQMRAQIDEVTKEQLRNQLQTAKNQAAVEKTNAGRDTLKGVKLFRMHNI